MTNRIGLRSALLATATLVATATPALAQSAADDDDGNEIIVTANRREENLQQVPIAISAVSAEQMELRGLTEVKDLSTIAPNVSIQGGTTNATAAVVSIRGIPSAADETQGFDSPIGLYLDGVFLARSSASSFEVADIERVEVLRGPQGTLFGRNTTGGAINFITRKPSEDTSLRVIAGIGNYGLWSGKAILNTGDIGGLRLSLGFLHRRRNGVVDNLLEPDNARDPGSYRTTGLRFAAEIDVSDNVTILNVVDFTRTRGQPHVQQLAAVGNGVFRPNVVFEGNTFAQVQPSNVAAYLAAATVTDPGCTKTVQRARLDAICNETDGPSTDRVLGNMFRITAELNAVTIRSTTAYRKWHNRIEGSDLDGLGTLRGPAFTQASTLNGMPAGLLAFIPSLNPPNAPAGTNIFVSSLPIPTVVQPLFSATNLREQEQFSQEIEIVSSGDGPFQWVLGAFYFDENGSERNVQSIGFVLDTNAAVFTDTNFGAFLGSGFRAGNPQRYRMVPTTSILDYTAGGESKAIYGQASYRPGGSDGALGITLGLRYTWDSKHVRRNQNGPVPYTSAADIAFNTATAKFNAPSGHLTFDLRATEDINLYARIARGYRSGGFNLRQSTHDGAQTVPPFGNRTLPLTPFDQEKIWSYELGAKTEFANMLRLNFSVFHNVYTDQLATIPVPIVGSGSFGTITVNAGKTTYTGFEVEGQLRLSEYFTIDGNFGYLDVNIKEFPGNDITNTTRNIAGLLRGAGYAPKYTASIAANVTVPLSGDARLTGRVGYNYAAGYQQFPNPLTAPFSQATEGDSRGLLDAQLRIDGINFGGTSFGITFWGKNITDKAYVSRSVDFGQLGFAGVIYGDPATFGASIEFEF